MIGLLNPSSSDFRPCVAILFTVYNRLGHGLCIIEYEAHYERVFRLYCRYRGIKAPQAKSSEKNMMHLYRSMRRYNTWCTRNTCHCCSCIDRLEGAGKKPSTQPSSTIRSPQRLPQTRPACILGQYRTLDNIEESWCRRRLEFSFKVRVRSTDCCTQTSV